MYSVKILKAVKENIKQRTLPSIFSSYYSTVVCFISIVFITSHQLIQQYLSFSSFVITALDLTISLLIICYLLKATISLCFMYISFKRQYTDSVARFSDTLQNCQPTPLQLIIIFCALLCLLALGIGITVLFPVYFGYTLTAVVTGIVMSAITLICLQMIIKNKALFWKG